MAARTMNVIQAAARLGVSRRTVYNYIDCGLLQVEGAKRRWRILTESVEALLL